jgi:hypothetical protein
MELLMQISYIHRRRMAFRIGLTEAAWALNRTQQAGAHVYQTTAAHGKA